MSDVPAQEPVSLLDPHVPADQGLSALGLLLQLAGTVFASLAAIGIVFAIAMVSEHGSRSDADAMLMMLVLALSLTRSLFQRSAGTELLYGHGGTHTAGIKRYIVAGLVHSVLMFMLITGKLHVPFRIAGAIGAGLAVWPLTLAVLLALPRFRRFSGALPVAEDKGFESASIVMTALGASGALLGCFVLYTMLQAGGRQLSQGPGVLLLLAVVLLVIRSFLHVSAGLSGLRETSVDRSVELANRYANFGVITSFCAGGAILLVSMSARFEVMTLALISGIVWLLIAWPLIIRRFFSERQFADLMATDQGASHRRAPDAGLTGLGWLLFAVAMMNASLLLPDLAIAPSDVKREMGQLMIAMGADPFHTVWWNVLLVVLQAWAGFELVRMSSISRVLATAYSVVAIVVGTYLAWPMLQGLSHVFRMGPQGMAMFLPMALKLVVPVATLVLVNRKMAPSAQARFRSPPAKV